MNPALLFFTAMLPASTSVLSEVGGRPDPLARHSVRRQLRCNMPTAGGDLELRPVCDMDPSMTAHVHRRIFTARMTVAAVFLLSITAVFALNAYTPLLWLLLLLVSFLSRWMGCPISGVMAQEWSRSTWR